MTEMGPRNSSDRGDRIRAINEKLSGSVRYGLAIASAVALLAGTVWLFDQGVFKSYFDLRSTREGRQLSDDAWHLLVFMAAILGGGIWSSRKLHIRGMGWHYTAGIVAASFFGGIFLGRAWLKLDYEYLIFDDLATTLTSWAAVSLMIVPAVIAAYIYHRAFPRR